MAEGENDLGKRVAVVLLNLGGPLKEGDIRPFLQNFFSDPRVVTLPAALRKPLAWWIARKRGRGEARKSYGVLGGRSPLLENTQAQARTLEKELRWWLPLARVFVCMRHWHPFAAEVAKEVAEYKPDSIVLLPLYPQYSTTTTLSALEDWRAAAEGLLRGVPVREICCYPENGLFATAAAMRVLEEMEKAGEGARVLFSAHGLPEKIVAAGDPYAHQCHETAVAIARQINARRQSPVPGRAAPPVDWRLCYQSRVGPLKWTGPSIEEELARAAEEHKDVVVCPIAFVSEHVETLVELDVLYKKLAGDLGVNYFRARTVGTHPAFITGLADLVRRVEKTPLQPRQCPSKFQHCYCEIKKKEGRK